MYLSWNLRVWWFPIRKVQNPKCAFVIQLGDCKRGGRLIIRHFCCPLLFSPQDKVRVCHHPVSRSSRIPFATAILDPFLCTPPELGHSPFLFFLWTSYRFKRCSSWILLHCPFNPCERVSDDPKRIQEFERSSSGLSFLIIWISGEAHSLHADLVLEVQKATDVSHSNKNS